MDTAILEAVAKLSPRALARRTALLEYVEYLEKTVACFKIELADTKNCDEESFSDREFGGMTRALIIATLSQLKNLTGK